MYVRLPKQIINQTKALFQRLMQAMSGDASAAASPRDLPRDVIAGILVHLPASDLRRFRRVCKEWRDVISDPAFIKSHMAQGPQAPTHTVVFVPSSSEQQRTGRALLFDEQWRLTARFDAGESQVLIGTCNGLLCFHDATQGVVKVVEPFTGEFTAVPAPKDSIWRGSAKLYCFGYDAAARRYKIVHKSCGRNGRQLKVFTVGEDEDWRTVTIAHDYCFDDDQLACDGGAVYWVYINGGEDGMQMYARFDLATEEIASVKRWTVDSWPIFCHHPWWQRGEPSIIRIRWFAGDWDSKGDHWPPNMNAMAVDVDAVNLPLHGRRLPGRQALQRGHLLLQEEKGALYAHRIMSKSVDGFDLGCEKLLIGTAVEKEKEPAKKISPPTTGQLVPVQRSQPSRRQPDIATFAYVPTVAPAPLALHVGVPLASVYAPLFRKLSNVKRD